MALTRLLFGRALANREGEQRRIGAFEGLPAMGLDGLGSVAYGPESALTVPAPLGAAGLAAIGPITWVILALLAVLFLSYWQAITAYPTSGSSYTVAAENIGTQAGLLAAAALMVDYMLNVAIGISAGVGALTSAVPWTLALCLAVVTLVNLRGTRESGLAFALPTYLFIASLSVVLAARTWRAWNGDPSSRGAASAAGRRHRRGADAVAGAASLRRRLHRDDRGGGGQQRRRHLPRVPRPPRAPHAGRDRGGARFAEGAWITVVVIPQLVLRCWWECLLHTDRERRLRRMLLRHGEPGIAVVGVPWLLPGSRMKAVSTPHLNDE